VNLASPLGGAIDNSARPRIDGHILEPRCADEAGTCLIWREAAPLHQHGDGGVDAADVALGAGAEVAAFLRASHVASALTAADEEGSSSTAR